MMKDMHYTLDLKMGSNNRYALRKLFWLLVEIELCSHRDFNDIMYRTARR